MAQRQKRVERVLAVSGIVGPRPEEATAIGPERVDEIEARLDQLIPSVQEAAGRHNAKVGEFQRRCGGRYYDGALLPQVRATLSCPSQ